MNRKAEINISKNKEKIQEKINTDSFQLQKISYH